MKTILFLLLSAFTQLIQPVQTNSCDNEVLVLSTIHGVHATNPNYTYDSLFHFIENYQPDIICIEVRSIDIAQDSNYLAQNYPFEMHSVIQRFKNRQVIGIDWLGSDIEGKAIPTDYWTKQAKIKKALKKLNQDSLILSQLKPLESLASKKMNLIKNCTLQELCAGKYDSLNSLYYMQMNSILKNSIHAEIPKFYAERDLRIAQNVESIVNASTNQRILILVGADHRSFLLDYLQQHGIKTEAVK